MAKKNVSTGRRRFLRSTAICAAATVFPAPLLSSTELPPATRRSGRPVRVRGQVRSDGRGLGGVAVSDGLAVVETGEDGTFELVSPADRELVHISVPSGQRIPRNPSGTARFYAPIRPDSRSEAEAIFDLEPLEQDDERHALFLLADVQTQDRDEMGWYHEQTVPDVLETRRDLGDVEMFGIACGDIMYDDLGLFPEYERSVERMGIPFFQVIGNHDLDFDGQVDEISSRTFTRHFGPRYYSFDRGAVHYVVLDDVFWHGQGYLGYLDSEQLTWLAADLRRIEPGRTVVVALHIPVLGTHHARQGEERPSISIALTNRELLYRLLEPFNAHVLTGHVHESEHLFENGVHEHVAGAVCGAWWSGPICADGTPCGYALYEIRGEQVTWRYKATGHPFEHQMRVLPRGSEPSAPQEIVCNVWDWDPSWTVLSYEDGERKGDMTRRVGKDPLAVELQQGPELPARRKWVEPYPTAHLFYANVSPGARRAAIHATDRFGRTFIEEVSAT